MWLTERFSSATDVSSALSFSAFFSSVEDESAVFRSAMSSSFVTTAVSGDWAWFLVRLDSFVCKRRKRTSPLARMSLYLHVATRTGFVQSLLVDLAFKMRWGCNETYTYITTRNVVSQQDLSRANQQFKMQGGGQQPGARNRYHHTSKSLQEENHGKTTSHDGNSECIGVGRRVGGAMPPWILKFDICLFSGKLFFSQFRVGKMKFHQCFLPEKKKPSDAHE